MKVISLKNGFGATFFGFNLVRELTIILWHQLIKYILNYLFSPFFIFCLYYLQPSVSKCFKSSKVRESKFFLISREWFDTAILCYFFSF